MKLHSYLKRLYALMLISIAFVAPSEAKFSPNKAVKQKWFIAESLNFTVVADGGEKKAIKLVQNLERFRAMFELFSDLKLDDSTRPLKVFATKRESTYDFFRGESKSLKNTSGFFMDRVSGNYAAIKLKGGGKYQLSTLFHEYTHYLVSNSSSANNPYWYNEGIAEYFGETEFKNDSVILIGQPVMHHLANINQMRWMRLDTLLNTNHIDSKNRNERYKIYSQGWLLVHFFESSQEMIASKKQFLKLLSEGVKPNDAIEQSTNLTFAEFEKKLRKYSKQRKIFFSQITLASPLNLKDIHVRKLTPDEVAYNLGEFALQARGNFESSRPFFEKAIEINPLNANAFAGLANTYLGKDEVKMDELVDKAKSIAPENPWVATISGHLNGIKMKKTEDEKEKTKYWNKAARDYNLAINSGGINVEAISSAAGLYFNKGEYEKSLALYETAYSYAPSNYSIRLSLISLYFANSMQNKAKSMATKVQRNHHMSDKALAYFEKWYGKQIKTWEEYHNPQKSPSNAQAF